MSRQGRTESRRLRHELGWFGCWPNQRWSYATPGCLFTEGLERTFSAALKQRRHCRPGSRVPQTTRACFSGLPVAGASAASASKGRSASPLGESTAKLLFVLLRRDTNHSREPQSGDDADDRKDAVDMDIFQGRDLRLLR